MAVTVQSMVDATRVESGLRGNQYYTDSQIAALLSDGGSELYDMFTAANQKYVISAFDFTTQSGLAGAKVTLPLDFQQGHSMDIYPDTAQRRTVRFLSNWLNRNDAPGSSWALTGRSVVYTFVNNQLWFYPPEQLPAAPFRLYYTPQWGGVQLPRSPAWTTGDATSGGGSILFLQKGAFTAADVGATIVIAGSSGADGTYTVVTFEDAQDVTVTPNPGTHSLTNTTTYLITPLNSVLPTYANPWELYMRTHASIAIRTGMQKDTSDLQAKLQALKARVNEMLANRQEEPQQPPLQADRGYGWDYDYIGPGMAS